MFKNDYFEVKKLSDEAVLIMNKDGQPYKWGEKATHCYCPAYNKEVSPFLMVRYSDNTWSLCHAEAGPMPEATKVPERKFGVCPIIFQEDFLEEKKENVSQTPYAQDTCMIIKSAAKDFVKSIKNRFLSRA